MFAIPARRLLVYVVAGLAVLVVGLVSLACLRSDSISASEGAPSPEDGLVVWSSRVDANDSTNDTPPPSAYMASTASSTSSSAPAMIYVQVAGAVRRPGVYQLSAQARVFEAIRAAGGFAEEADQDAVAQAALLTDGCRVFVPYKGAAVQQGFQGPELSSAGMTAVSSAGTARAAASSRSRVSLNEATAAELEALPGVGPALAERIVTYRETNGPFQSVDELINVPGIGPTKLEQLRPYVQP